VLDSFRIPFGPVLRVVDELKKSPCKIDVIDNDPWERRPKIRVRNDSRLQNSIKRITFEGRRKDNGEWDTLITPLEVLLDEPREDTFASGDWFELPFFYNSEEALYSKCRVTIWHIRQKKPSRKTFNVKR
jgi:hypothetical protein